MNVLSSLKSGLHISLTASSESAPCFRHVLLPLIPLRCSRHFIRWLFQQTRLPNLLQHLQSGASLTTEPMIMILPLPMNFIFLTGKLQQQVTILQGACCCPGCGGCTNNQASRDPAERPFKSELLAQIKPKPHFTERPAHRSARC